MAPTQCLPSLSALNETRCSLGAKSPVQPVPPAKPMEVASGQQTGQGPGCLQRPAGPPCPAQPTRGRRLSAVPVRVTVSRSDRAVCCRWGSACATRASPRPRVALAPGQRCRAAGRLDYDRAALRLGLRRPCVAGVWHECHIRCWLSGPAHGPDQPNKWSGRRESNPHDQLGRSVTRHHG